MPITPKEMVRLMNKNGFVEVRQKGSHLMMINYETKRQTTVPMHRKDLPKGTERMIYKQAGLLK